MAGSMSQFYAGRTLFLTGGSGFLGKHMIEKLLRSCPAIDQILVLIRTKKGKSPEERMDQLFQSPVFNRLKVEQPNYRKKVRAIPGDIFLDDLGICDADRARIEANASVFIHSAASLNFAEPLRDAVKSNILPTRKVLHLAKASKNVDAYVHVSTAYSQVDKSHIGEMVYDAPIDPYRLLKMMEVLDDDQLAQLTPKLLAPRPNTYTFTKACAEKLVDLERGDVPVAIVRPSIITASHQQPFEGFVDNYSASTGIIAGCAMGAVRHMYGNDKLALDFIPVDMAGHSVLAAARHVALNRTADIPFVLNCNSMTLNHFPVGEVCKILTTQAKKTPSSKYVYMGLGRPFLYIGPKRVAREFNVNVTLPLRAHVLDLLAKVTGQKPRVVKMQKQFTKLQEVLEYFCINEFHWEAKNVHKLLDGLPERDREDFNFDVRTIDWHEYHKDYYHGILQYLLKETPVSRPAPQPNQELTHRPVMNYSTK